MKNFRKIAAVLSVCTALLSANSVFADFTDMPDGDLRAPLEAAVANGLLQGTETGELKPYDNITRAQMGAILVRAMGATKTEDISGFADMNESQWFYDEMSKAVAMGAFKGDGANLNPEVNITFQEAFIVVARIFDLGDIEYDNTVNPYAGYYDADQVASWAKEEVGYILRNGYWTSADGYLRPTDYITRAEFAVLMDNIVEKYVDVAGDFTEAVSGNIVVRVPDVAIKNVDLGENDVYISDGVAGKVTFDGANLRRVVARGGNVDYLSGKAFIIRMLTPGLEAYISNNATVEYFDGAGCTLNIDPITIGE